MTPSREQSCRTWEIYHGSPASLTRISTCWGRTTYDTDLYLIRNGITLRRRRGDRDPGWHLKLALGGDSRRKVPLPLGRPTGQVPLELAALVRAVTGGKGDVAGGPDHHYARPPGLTRCRGKVAG